jgi:hypothetical protein
MTKVIVRKLGKHGAVGLADSDTDTIEIDPRQKPKSYFDTIIHEALHIAFPGASETQVKKSTKTVRDILWGHGYRKVDVK